LATASQQVFTSQESTPDEHCTVLPLFTGVASLHKRKLSHRARTFVVVVVVVIVVVVVVVVGIVVGVVVNAVVVAAAVTGSSLFPLPVVVVVDMGSQQELSLQESTPAEHCTSLPLFTGLSPLQEEKLSHVATASQQVFTSQESTPDEHCTALPLLTGVSPLQEKKLVQVAASQHVSVSQEASSPEHSTELPLFTDVSPLQEEKLSQVAFAPKILPDVFVLRSPGEHARRRCDEGLYSPPYNTLHAAGKPPSAHWPLGA